MSIGLHIRLIYSIICFLKACIRLNLKVVPNDTFKLGGESVKTAIYVVCTADIISDLPLSPPNVLYAFENEALSKIRTLLKSKYKGEGRFKNS